MYENTKPVITIFPNIHMHLEAVQRKKQQDKKEKLTEEKVEEKQQKEKKEKKNVLKSGIKGLDDLLPLYSEGKGKDSGFEQGEIILVLGSPGAGKTLLGLHFLAEGYIQKDKNDKEQEKVLWVSFESDLDGLELATRSFADETNVKKFVKQIKEDMDKKEEDKNAMFRFFPPAQLDPNELVNFLLEACGSDKNKLYNDEGCGNDSDKNKLQKIVIDSVNDIEQAFPTDMAFKTFMTSLVQLLREKGVTMMFLYRTRSFFGKSEDIGRTLASVVDTIICLKILEIQNAVQKGLFLLKVRGREHKSNLLSLDFKEKEGMSVIDRGWNLSGLISGETGEIKEPRVSVKLFFENRNEFLINALIVSEYNRRFKGGQTTFVHVLKPQIYSEFWSFKGSSGAGHSNVRVVSLCDYWAAHFQHQKKLYNLSDYVSATTYQLVHREEFWRRCASYSFKKHSFEIFSIPNYVDIGVLSFHEDIVKLESFWKAVDLEFPKLTDDLDPKKLIEPAKKQLANLTWNKLNANDNKAIEEVVKNLKNNTFPRYLFAMPSLESKASFVSFFLEVYWSFGGVIFDLRNLFNEYADNCFKNKEKKNEDILFFGSPQIDLSPNLQFVAEILMLIPERILNDAIRSMNWKVPNFLGDICRHGEALLDKYLEEKETTQSEKTTSSQVQKKTAVSMIDNPLEAFFKLPYIKKVKNSRNNPIIVFIRNLCDELKKDEIWKETWEIKVGEKKKSKYLLSALEKAKEIVIPVIIKENGKNDKDDNNDEKKHILIILYFVVSRIITNRERYHKLIEWYLKRKKEEESEKLKSNLTVEKYSYLSEIIKIGKIPEQDVTQIKEASNNILKNNREKSADIETFEFLFQLVKGGVSPNPHLGNLTEQPYLSRKWSGDVAPRPKLPHSEDIFGSLDLNMPPEAYEYKTYDIEKTDYHIAPLPSCINRYNKKDIKRISYAVMGLWSLGITIPALSPEIGWIFIDALTEDRFVRLRARKGLGLPAKVPAYKRKSIQDAQPEIYGMPDYSGNPKGGIVQYYELATQDKAQEKPTNNLYENGVYYRTRERVSIPFYYQIEEFLIKELSRFFEPSFFAILEAKGDNDRIDLIKSVLQRIHNRIKNFLIKEFDLDKEDK